MMEDHSFPLSSEKIKAEAIRLGFSACGITKAHAVDQDTACNFKDWLVKGGHADMHYMENYIDKRLDPRKLLPGLKSIVCVALNYTPNQRIPNDQYQIATYAYGLDYHNIVKQRLHQLATSILPHTQQTQTIDQQSLQPLYRAFADSAPILERYWAVQAGLGWVGRHHQLIVTGAGSQFFLGELLIAVEVDEYDEPQPNRCGNCHLCIDACPTHALSFSNHQASSSFFDASKCLSYLTIENRGAIPPAFTSRMGNYIYGCDQCQKACPWNRKAPATNDPLLVPKPELLNMTKERWQHLTEKEYQQLFKGSAVKRAKYTGLMRNIEAISQQNSENDKSSSQSFG